MITVVTYVLDHNLPPSGVTTAPATPAIQEGGKLPNLLFCKRKIVQLGSKMYHILVNLAISRREKYLGVQKASGGGKRLSGGGQKIMSTFFLLF